MDDDRMLTWPAIQKAVPSATRRDFLRLVGVGSATLMLPGFLAACNEDPIAPPSGATLDFSTDNGILNFAYLMAHFQYEFYRWVTFSPYVGATALEMNLTNSVFWKFYNHPQTYRNVYRNTVIPRFSDQVDFNFRSVDFTSRSVVFGLSIDLEDKSNAVFCDLLSRCREVETVGFLSKMASVQGRRAALVRDLADVAADLWDTPSRTRFAADAYIPAATGLEPTVTAEEYLAFISPYTTGTFSIRGA